MREEVRRGHGHDSVPPLIAGCQTFVERLNRDPIALRGAVGKRSRRWAAATGPLTHHRDKIPAVHSSQNGPPRKGIGRESLQSL